MDRVQVSSDFLYGPDFANTSVGLEVALKGLRITLANIGYQWIGEVVDGIRDWHENRPAQIEYTAKFEGTGHITFRRVPRAGSLTALVKVSSNRLYCPAFGDTAISFEFALGRVRTALANIDYGWIDEVIGGIRSWYENEPAQIAYTANLGNVLHITFERVAQTTSSPKREQEELLWVKEQVGVSSPINADNFPLHLYNEEHSKNILRSLDSEGIAKLLQRSEYIGRAQGKFIRNLFIASEINAQDLRNWLDNLNNPVYAYVAHGETLNIVPVDNFIYETDGNQYRFLTSEQKIEFKDIRGGSQYRTYLKGSIVMPYSGNGFIVVEDLPAAYPVQIVVPEANEHYLRLAALRGYTQDGRRVIALIAVKEASERGTFEKYVNSVFTILAKNKVTLEAVFTPLNERGLPLYVEGKSLEEARVMVTNKIFARMPATGADNYDIIWNARQDELNGYANSRSIHTYMKDLADGKPLWAVRKTDVPIREYVTHVFYSDNSLSSPLQSVSDKLLENYWSEDWLQSRDGSFASGTYPQPVISFSDYLLRAVLSGLAQPKIIDCACGDLFVSRNLKSSIPALEIAGVDFASLESAKIKEAEQEGIRYVQQDVTQLSLPEEFDAALAVFLLPYLDLKQQVKFIQSLKAHLRGPQALIAVIHHHLSDIVARFGGRLPNAKSSLPIYSIILGLIDEMTGLDQEKAKDALFRVKAGTKSLWQNHPINFAGIFDDLERKNSLGDRQRITELARLKANLAPVARKMQAFVQVNQQLISSVNNEFNSAKSVKDRFNELGVNVLGEPHILYNPGNFEPLAFAVAATFRGRDTQDFSLMNEAVVRATEKFEAEDKTAVAIRNQDEVRRGYDLERLVEGLVFNTADQYKGAVKKYFELLRTNLPAGICCLAAELETQLVAYYNHNYPHLLPATGLLFKACRQDAAEFTLWLSALLRFSPEFKFGELKRLMPGVHELVAAMRGKYSTSEELYQALLSPNATQTSSPVTVRFDGTVEEVAMEFAPLVKVGGQGDVVYELPLSLVKTGIRTGVVIPYFKVAAEKLAKLDITAEDLPNVTFRIELKRSARIVEGHVKRVDMHGISVKMLVIDKVISSDGRLLENDWFEKPYQTKAKEFYESIILSQGAAQILPQLGKVPDIVCNSDHHTALLTLYMRIKYAKAYAHSGNKFTIHNIGYQGEYDDDFAKKIGFNNINDLIEEIGLENINDFIVWSGKLNFMAVVPAYIKYRQAQGNYISTVSMTYAQDIRSTQFEIDKLLQDIANRFGGIQNGIDFDVWNPATDEFLPYKYSIDNGIEQVRTARDQNYQELVRLLVNIEMLEAIKVSPDRVYGKLEYHSGRPSMGVVSRYVDQKQIDIIGQMLRDVQTQRKAPLEADFVMLGTGEAWLEEEMAKIVQEFPGTNVIYVRAYSEKIAHMIYGSVDMLLVPSDFEPSGLTQLIGMRYGAVPIVRATGGLADTVFEGGERWTGFRFNGVSRTFDTPSFEKLKKTIEDTLWATQNNGHLTINALREQALEAFARYVWAIQHKLHNNNELYDTIQRAILAYHNRGLWNMIVENGMREQNDWRDRSINDYLSVYNWLQREINVSPAASSPVASIHSQEVASAPSFEDHARSSSPLKNYGEVYWCLSSELAHAASSPSAENQAAKTEPQRVSAYVHQLERASGSSADGRGMALNISSPYAVELNREDYRTLRTLGALSASQPIHAPPLAFVKISSPLVPIRRAYNLKFDCATADSDYQINEGDIQTVLQRAWEEGRVWPICNLAIANLDEFVPIDLPLVSPAFDLYQSVEDATRLVGNFYDPFPQSNKSASYLKLINPTYRTRLRDRFRILQSIAKKVPHIENVYTAMVEEENDWPTLFFGKDQAQRPASLLSRAEEIGDKKIIYFGLNSLDFVSACQIGVPGLIVLAVHEVNDLLIGDHIHPSEKGVRPVIHQFWQDLLCWHDYVKLAGKEPLAPNSSRQQMLLRKALEYLNRMGKFTYESNVTFRPLPGQREQCVTFYGRALETSFNYPKVPMSFEGCIMPEQGYADDLAGILEGFKRKFKPSEASSPAVLDTYDSRATFLVTDGGYKKRNPISLQRIYQGPFRLYNQTLLSLVFLSGQAFMAQMPNAGRGFMPIFASDNLFGVPDGPLKVGAGALKDASPDANLFFLGAPAVNNTITAIIEETKANQQARRIEAQRKLEVLDRTINALGEVSKESRDFLERAIAYKRREIEAAEQGGSTMERVITEAVKVSALSVIALLLIAHETIEAVEEGLSLEAQRLICEIMTIKAAEAGARQQLAAVEGKNLTAPELEDIAIRAQGNREAIAKKIKERIPALAGHNDEVWVRKILDEMVAQGLIGLGLIAAQPQTGKCEGFGEKRPYQRIIELALKGEGRVVRNAYGLFPTIETCQLIFKRLSVAPQSGACAQLREQPLKLFSTLGEAVFISLEEVELANKYEAEEKKSLVPLILPASWEKLKPQDRVQLWHIIHDSPEGFKEKTNIYVIMLEGEWIDVGTVPQFLKAAEWAAFSEEGRSYFNLPALSENIIDCHFDASRVEFEDPDDVFMHNVTIVFLGKRGQVRIGRHVKISNTLIIVPEDSALEIGWGSVPQREAQRTIPKTEEKNPSYCYNYYIEECIIEVPRGQHVVLNTELTQYAGRTACATILYGCQFIGRRFLGALTDIAANNTYIDLIDSNHRRHLADWPTFKEISDDYLQEHRFGQYSFDEWKTGKDGQLPQLDAGQMADDLVRLYDRLREAKETVPTASRSEVLRQASHIIAKMRQVRRDLMEFPEIERTLYYLIRQRRNDITQQEVSGIIQQHSEQLIRFTNFFFTVVPDAHKQAPSVSCQRFFREALMAKSLAIEFLVDLKRVQAGRGTLRDIYLGVIHSSELEDTSVYPSADVTTFAVLGQDKLGTMPRVNQNILEYRGDMASHWSAGLNSIFNAEPKIFIAMHEFRDQTTGHAFNPKDPDHRLACLVASLRAALAIGVTTYNDPGTMSSDDILRQLSQEEARILLEERVREKGLRGLYIEQGVTLDDVRGYIVDENYAGVKVEIKYSTLDIKKVVKPQNQGVNPLADAGGSSPLSGELTSNITSWILRSMQSQAQALHMDIRDYLFDSRLRVARVSLDMIRQLLVEGTIDPTIELKPAGSDTSASLPERKGRIGFYALKGRPFNWDMLFIGLAAIAQRRLDKVIFIIGKGPGESDYYWEQVKTHALAHAKELLGNFSPFFVFHEMASVDGEHEMSGILKNNPGISAYYIAGAMHCNWWKPVRITTGGQFIRDLQPGNHIRRGTPEYHDWVMRNGVIPEADTVQKLHEIKKEHTQPITALFIRQRRPLAHIKNPGVDIDSLDAVGDANTSDILLALRGEGEQRNLAFLPHEVYQYLLAHPGYTDMLLYAKEYQDETTAQARREQRAEEQLDMAGRAARQRQRELLRIAGAITKDEILDPSSANELIVRVVNLIAPEVPGLFTTSVLAGRLWPQHHTRLYLPKRPGRDNASRIIRRAEEIVILYQLLNQTGINYDSCLFYHPYQFSDPAVPYQATEAIFAGTHLDTTNIAHLIDNNRGYELRWRFDFPRLIVPTGVDTTMLFKVSGRVFVDAKTGENISIAQLIEAYRQRYSKIKIFTPTRLANGSIELTRVNRLVSSPSSQATHPYNEGIFVRAALQEAQALTANDSSLSGKLLQISNEVGAVQMVQENKLILNNNILVVPSAFLPPLQKRHLMPFDGRKEFLLALILVAAELLGREPALSIEQAHQIVGTEHDARRAIYTSSHDPHTFHPYTDRVGSWLYEELNLASQAPGVGMTMNDSMFSNRWDWAREFFGRIAERLHSKNPLERIKPDMAFNLDPSDRFSAVDRLARAAFYYMAGNPPHIDHLLIALKMIGEFGLDKLILGIQSGKDHRKPHLVHSEKYRYELNRMLVQQFDPFFAFRANTSPDGETDMFEALGLNPLQRALIYYIAGGDHAHLWAEQTIETVDASGNIERRKIRPPDTLLPGTKEYLDWVREYGFLSPDTIAKLGYRYPVDYPFNHTMHQFGGMLFIPRGTPPADIPPSEIPVYFVEEVGDASATRVREALWLLCRDPSNPDFAKIPGGVQKGTATTDDLGLMLHMVRDYIEKHPRFLDTILFEKAFYTDLAAGLNRVHVLDQRGVPEVLGSSSPASFDSTDNILSWVGNQMKSQAQTLGMDTRDYIFDSRLYVARANLNIIRQLLTEGTIDPTIELNPSVDTSASLPERKGRIGFYALKGRPFNWDMLFIGLAAIAQRRLDKVIFIIGKGPGESDYYWEQVKTHALAHAKELLGNFSPFFVFHEMASVDGEHEMSGILKNNPGISAYYIAGAMHCNWWKPVRITTGGQFIRDLQPGNHIRRGTPEYHDWVMRNGVIPEADTVQKLHEIKKEHTQPITALFIRQRRPLAHIKNPGVDIDSLDAVGDANTSDILLALRGEGEQRNLAFLPYEVYQNIMADPRYCDKLVNPHHYNSAELASSRMKVVDKVISDLKEFPAEKQSKLLLNLPAFKVQWVGAMFPISGSEVRILPDSTIRIRCEAYLPHFEVPTSEELQIISRLIHASVWSNIGDVWHEAPMRLIGHLHHNVVFQADLPVIGKPGTSYEFTTKTKGPLGDETFNDRGNAIIAITEQESELDSFSSSPTESNEDIEVSGRSGEAPGMKRELTSSQLPDFWEVYYGLMEEAAAREELATIEANARASSPSSTSISQALLFFTRTESASKQATSSSAASDEREEFRRERRVLIAQLTIVQDVIYALKSELIRLKKELSASEAPEAIYEKIIITGFELRSARSHGRAILKLLADVAEAFSLLHKKAEPEPIADILAELLGQKAIPQSSSPVALPFSADREIPQTQEEVLKSLGKFNIGRDFPPLEMSAIEEPERILHAVNNFGAANVLETMIGSQQVRAPPKQLLQRFGITIFDNIDSLLYYDENGVPWIVISPLAVAERKHLVLALAYAGVVANELYSLLFRVQASATGEVRARESAIKEAQQHGQRTIRFIESSRANGYRHYNRGINLYEINTLEGFTAHVNGKRSGQHLLHHYPFNSLVAFGHSFWLTSSLAENLIASALDIFNTFWVAVDAFFGRERIKGILVYGDENVRGKKKHPGQQRKEVMDLAGDMIFDIIEVRAASIRSIIYPAINDGKVEVEAVNPAQKYSRDSKYLAEKIRAEYEKAVLFPEKHRYSDISIDAAGAVSLIPVSLRRQHRSAVENELRINSKIIEVKGENGASQGSSPSGDKGLVIGSVQNSSSPLAGRAQKENLSVAVRRLFHSKATDVVAMVMGIQGAWNPVTMQLMQDGGDTGLAPNVIPDLLQELSGIRLVLESRYVELRQLHNEIKQFVKIDTSLTAAKAHELIKKFGDIRDAYRNQRKELAAVRAKNSGIKILEKLPFGLLDKLIEILDGSYEIAQGKRIKKDITMRELKRLVNEALTFGMKGRFTVSEGDSFDPDALIRVDPIELQNTIANLSINTLEAALDIESTRMWVGITRRGSLGIVYVSDNAKGISKENRKKSKNGWPVIFELDFSTKCLSRDERALVDEKNELRGLGLVEFYLMQVDAGEKGNRSVRSRTTDQIPGISALGALEIYVRTHKKVRDYLSELAALAQKAYLAFSMIERRSSNITRKARDARVCLASLHAEVDQFFRSQPFPVSEYGALKDFVMRKIDADYDIVSGTIKASILGERIPKAKFQIVNEAIDAAKDELGRVLSVLHGLSKGKRVSQGTTFALYLPVVSSAAGFSTEEEALANHRSSSPGAFNRRKLLIASGTALLAAPLAVLLSKAALRQQPGAAKAAYELVNIRLGSSVDYQLYHIVNTQIYYVEFANKTDQEFYSPADAFTVTSKQAAELYNQSPNNNTLDGVNSSLLQDFIAEGILYKAASGEIRSAKPVAICGCNQALSEEQRQHAILHELRHGLYRTHGLYKDKINSIWDSFTREERKYLLFVLGYIATDEVSFNLSGTLSSYYGNLTIDDILMELSGYLADDSFAAKKLAALERRLKENFGKFLDDEEANGTVTTIRKTVSTFSRKAHQVEANLKLDKILNVEGQGSSSSVASSDNNTMFTEISLIVFNKVARGPQGRLPRVPATLGFNYINSKLIVPSSSPL
ncbi:MAG: glycogen/starch synthase, partial [Candidatus Omnitrophica bacterium]|nr:glycogen/starch synthase [Candidatus Omnitrophota bacterium]